MKLTLNYIPNMKQFLSTVNNFSGHIFIELGDQSYLNLKGEGEGKFYLESIGQYPKGLRVLTEHSEDAVTLIETLIAS